MDLLRQCSQKRRAQSLLPQASIPLARTCTVKVQVRSAKNSRIATAGQYYASSQKLYQVCSLRISCRCTDAGPGLYHKNCFLPQAFDPSCCNALNRFMSCHLSYTQVLPAFMAAAGPVRRHATKSSTMAFHMKKNHDFQYSCPASHATPSLK